MSKHMLCMSKQAPKEEREGEERLVYKSNGLLKPNPRIRQIFYLNYGSDRPSSTLEQREMLLIPRTERASAVHVLPFSPNSLITSHLGERRMGEGLKRREWESMIIQLPLLRSRRGEAHETGSLM